MPLIMYGTAWKKERTTELVTMAVKAGFRGIDYSLPTEGKRWSETLYRSYSAGLALLWGELMSSTIGVLPLIVRRAAGKGRPSWGRRSMVLYRMGW